ncbi:hypothetical protein CYMTET_22350 [Cymbomonas tetramitiformis]|uniref:Uncharacterized protein n=1 Tax=Cymbomonas tetramitiformis TaxID=36881 RepID=A0AAE0L2A2_9CHLO|nr:hypothetical protein CYMTET_22350 [Cymbomonas tetramitiformis]
MQAYDLCLDGSDSDSESNRSQKITPLGLSETMSSEQEEFATPEADRATGMEGIQREEDATSKRTDKAHPQDTPPKRRKDKKEDLRRALDRPIDYKKVDRAPTDKIPSLLEHSTSKNAESLLEKVTRIYQRRPRATENPEARIFHTVNRWHLDRREVLVAEDPPAQALKLGVPVVREERLSLIHVRSVTGCSLDPSDTGPTGFPYTGTPQLKIVDLDESIKEVLKYLREVLLLEAVSPAAAELIIQQPYPWGFATTTCWLPSKEVSDEVATREIAIIDKKQVLLDHHRGHIVQAIVEHVEKLTANTTALTGTDDIFDFHVPSRQWAPSTPGNPSSLLQWKRTGGGYTINYYAIFTENAYDALAKAGKQTIRVLAGVDDAGRHISTSITVEVGRWSAQGAGTIQRQTPRAARGREARGGRIDDIAEEVASKLINKVGSKADEVFQSATNKQPTPETKQLLKNINLQLERFNESKPVTLEELRDLHKEQERNAGVRHTEITQEVRGFHKTYQETGSAMVSTLTALADRLTGESKHQAPDQPLHFTRKPASQTSAREDEYRGIPYRGPKADSKKKQPPPKRQAVDAGERAIEAEPPAKRRAQGDAQASAQVEAQLESPRLTPPVTRKGSSPPSETGVGTDHPGLKAQLRKAIEIEGADPILLA